MRRVALLSGLVLLLGTSCAYRYQFDTGLPPSGVRVEEWRHFWMWGSSGAPPVDLERACPTGVSRFGSSVSFLNWLPAFFSLGVYAPRTVFVECASAPATAPEVQP